MKKFCFTLFFITATLFSNLAYCQNSDKEKRIQIEYFTKEFSISKDKAEQVALILEQYKAKAKSTISDKILSEEERRGKLNILVDEKNINLAKVLTPEQLKRIIPSTERRN